MVLPVIGAVYLVRELLGFNDDAEDAEGADEASPEEGGFLGGARGVVREAGQQARGLVEAASEAVDEARDDALEAWTTPFEETAETASALSQATIALGATAVLLALIAAVVVVLALT